MVSRFGFLLFRDEGGAMSESESSWESASRALARAILRTRTGSVKKFEGVRSCGYVVRLEYVELVGRGLGFWGVWNSEDVKKGVTYDFTHWASDCLLIHTIGPGVPYPACVDHTHDGLFFKAMRAFLAADGILHGE